MTRGHFTTWVVAIASGLLLLAAGPADQTSTTTTPADNAAAIKTVVIPVDGEINDYVRDELVRRFQQAREMGAKTVILRMNTYGGLVTSGLDISRFLRDETDMHTIAYVKTKAISAGALISIACNEIYMSPGGQIGDCAPIIFDSDDKLHPLEPTERAKEESPVLADFLSSARKNGYSPLVAESMVHLGQSVHVLINDKGQQQIVNDEDNKKLLSQGWKALPGVPDPVNGPNTLLTVGPDLAQAVGLSKGTVNDVNDLASQLHLTIVADLSPGFGDLFVELLSNPAVRLILMTAFGTALYIALSAPGHGAAEAVALLSLGLLLGIPLLTGYASWWEIVMIIVGLALCAFEIFVFPGHGVSLAAGLLMVLAGLVLTFVGREPAGPGFMPSEPQTYTAVRTGLMVVCGGLFCSALLCVWLRKYLPELPYFRRLILTETSGGAIKLAPTQQSDDVWPFVGTVGEAVSELKPGGSARFPFADDTRTAAVVSSSGFVPPGSKIQVQEVRGSRIVVRQVMAGK